MPQPLYQITSLKYDENTFEDVEELIECFHDKDDAIAFFNNYEPLEDEQVELVQIINLMSK